MQTLGVEGVVRRSSTKEAIVFEEAATLGWLPTPWPRNQYEANNRAVGVCKSTFVASYSELSQREKSVWHG
jgi:hypothetical protein